MKQGFEIAGRIFRFLGYSTSGLREHTTWFMADFEHPEEGLVTPEKIRSGLGDFRSCINHPSKYAARIAQAFSGTDPSYKIRAGQWTEGVEDLGNSPYEFTDGQGSISIELRDRIWDVLCEAWPDKRKLVLKPSAVCTSMTARLHLKLSKYLHSSKSVSLVGARCRSGEFVSLNLPRRLQGDRRRRRATGGGSNETPQLDEEVRRRQCDRSGDRNRKGFHQARSCQTLSVSEAIRFPDD